MNKNIEIIIPGKLAAVKFTWIPFIQEIEYRPDDKVPAYTESCRITNEGILLLNKDRRGYEILKDIFKRVIPLSRKQLRNQHTKIKEKSHCSSYDELYMLCIEAEQERREKAKRRRS